jgi:cytochrome c oxidase accessory protein FixG
MEKNTRFDEAFRDSIATINREGRREYVFPKKPGGKLYNYRLVVSWFLLTVLFLMPFIRFHGEPYFIIDIINRRFISFGQVFWPQDTYLFAIMMLTLVVFIVVFTVSLGRLWCGWACPQTIFLEMLFRKIEYFIDGNPSQQRKLKKQSWNGEKIWKRSFKFIIFIVLAMMISATLFSWFIGTEQLLKIAGQPFSENRSTIIAMLLLAGFMLFIYSWFREQVCVILCPYGRLQSVLLDANTILVAYDYQRGEPHGNYTKDEDRSEAVKGDCIDCKACVEVCPTAIDIRNGTQLECINCTACIDACNHTMERIGKPKGLIRFDSEKGISTGEKVHFNGRLTAYIVVLAALFIFLLFLIFSRADVETTILRTPGLLFQRQPNGLISNLYNIKVVNKKREKFTLEVRLLSPKGEIQMPSGKMVVKEAASTEDLFFVVLSESLAKGEIPIKLGIFSGEKLIEKIEVTFVGENRIGTKYLNEQKQ